jgi:hypothetical protein
MNAIGGEIYVQCECARHVCVLVSISEPDFFTLGGAMYLCLRLMFNYDHYENNSPSSSSMSDVSLQLA